jgi:hypothetical protein
LTIHTAIFGPASDAAINKVNADRLMAELIAVAAALQHYAEPW